MVVQTSLLSMIRKMMRKIDVLVVLTLSVVLSGCRLRRPDDVLPPRKMEQFLYDFHMAQAVIQDLPREEKYTTPAYVEWAYEKNGITREQFNTSLVWYTRYPKELAKIYKRLSNRVDDEYRAATRSLSQIEKKSFEVQSGDSVDMWYLDKTALLNSSVYMNKLTYRINRDTTFYPGDTVCLNMYGTFVSADSIVPDYAYVSMSVYYGDSVSTADTVLSTSGPVALSLVLNDKRTFSSLSGSVNYLNPTDNRNSILVVSDMELMRYHKKVVPAVPADSSSILSPAEL